MDKSRAQAAGLRTKKMEDAYTPPPSLTTSHNNHSLLDCLVTKETAPAKEGTMPENTISDPAVFVKRQRYTDCNAVLWTICIKWWLQIQAIHPSSIRGIVSHFIECIVLEYSKTNTPFPRL